MSFPDWAHKSARTKSRDSFLLRPVVNQPLLHWKAWYRPFHLSAYKSIATFAPSGSIMSSTGGVCDNSSLAGIRSKTRTPPAGATGRAGTRASPELPAALAGGSAAGSSRRGGREAGTTAPSPPAGVSAKKCLKQLLNFYVLESHFLTYMCVY